MLSEFMNGKKTLTGITMLAIAAATGYDVGMLTQISDEVQKIIASIGTILAVYGYMAKGKK